MKRDQSLVIVIPTYNEALTLPLLIEELRGLALPAIRIMVVDDASPDGTAELAASLDDPDGVPITVLRRPGKAGLGRAYLEGFAAALAVDCDYVVQMDADGSHDPRFLAPMLQTAISTRADVVIGSRYAEGGVLDPSWPTSRRLLSRWGNFYARTILRIPIRDITAGYKLWRSSALRTMDLSAVRSGGYSFQIEMNYYAYLRGFTIIETPISFVERRAGRSKMSLKVKIEAAVNPFMLRMKKRSILRQRRESAA